MLKMKNLLSELVWRVLLAFSTFALFAALSVGIQTAPVSAASWTFVRIFHASPNAGIVDVFMDGSKLVSNFQYGTLTDYAPVTPGSHKIQVAVIGTGANAAILSQTLSLQAGVPYTVVALGTQATGFSLQVFADNNGVAGNLAKVRVYHLSSGAGVVNVSEGKSTLISGLPYAQASNYVSIAPGSYTLNVTVMPNNTSTTLPVQLKPWTVTSIFAIKQVKTGSASSNSPLQFVQSQITGIPGMPNTGSDPHAVPSPIAPIAPASSPWTWPMLAFIGTSSALILVSLRSRLNRKQVNKTW